MVSMFVTLDVSKLSGWLNADTFCRVEMKRGHTMRGEVRAKPGGGRWRATAAQAACTGGLDCRFGVGHGEERTENVAHMFVTLDVSKLSGWLNDDACCRESPKGGHAGCGVRCGPGGGRAWGGGGASGMHGEGPIEVQLKAGGQGTREAHRKHAAHFRDAGRVEA